jgi:hypothetical protein
MNKFLFLLSILYTNITVTMDRIESFRRKNTILKQSASALSAIRTHNKSSFKINPILVDQKIDQSKMALLSSKQSSSHSESFKQK